MAKNIVKTDGLLISEYEPGVGASKYTYVQRDRLQTGLSYAVFVLQTKVDGGTMHASKSNWIKNASFVFNPHLEDESYSGNRYLINKKCIFISWCYWNWFQ